MNKVDSQSLNYFTPDTGTYSHANSLHLEVKETYLHLVGISRDKGL